MTGFLIQFFLGILIFVAFSLLNLARRKKGWMAYAPVYFIAFPFAGLNESIRDYVGDWLNPDSEKDLSGLRRVVRQRGRLSFVIDGFLLPCVFALVLSRFFNEYALIGFIFSFLIWRNFEIIRTLKSLQDIETYTGAYSLKVSMRRLYYLYIAHMAIVVFELIFVYFWSKPLFEGGRYDLLIERVAIWIVFAVVVPFLGSFFVGALSGDVLESK